MADIYIRSLLETAAVVAGTPLPWLGVFPVFGEPGWYEHSGRMYIQGAFDLAPEPGSNLTIGEEEALAAGAEEEPLMVGGLLLRVPPEYGPRPGTPSIVLLTDPYYTTPGYMKTQPTLAWVPPEVGRPYWELVLPSVQVPKGSYGELRLILSCWWDTLSSDHPGAGVNDPFEATGDFADAGGTIANKGSRVWLAGTLDCTGGPSEPEDPVAERLLHVGAPLGPHSPMREMLAPGIPTWPGGFPEGPSPELLDLHGYTEGLASGKGRALIHVLPLTDELACGVFPTDRYTFYDVRPVPPHSKPSLGRYGSLGLANPSKEPNPAAVVGLSGPTSGSGMSLFVGDISRIPVGPSEPLALYLSVPPGAGGPGFGYYRFDIWNATSLLDNGPLVEVGPLAGQTYVSPNDPTLTATKAAWLGPKVVFQTVNWASEAEGGQVGMEAPVDFKYNDVTGNGTEKLSGWGFFPIPGGPKSMLVSMTTDPTQAAILRALYTVQTGKVAPVGATMLIVEWGEVGKLPFESHEKGSQVLYDPTPYLTNHRGPLPPGAGEVYAFELELTLLLIELTGAIEPHRLELVEKIRAVAKSIVENEGKYQYWLDEFEADKPRGKPIKPFGDAGIRVGEGAIRHGVPIWVGEYPLPAWLTMSPEELLDLTNAGYAAPPSPGEVIVGPGRFALVPKN